MVRGFLVNATNPKGLVFFLAVLPQFVVPTEPLLPQYLAIGGRWSPSTSSSWGSTRAWRCAC